MDLVTLVDLHARMQSIIADAEPMPGGGLIQIRTRTEHRSTGSVTAVEIEISGSGKGTTLWLRLPAAVNPVTVATCTPKPAMGAGAR